MANTTISGLAQELLAGEVDSATDVLEIDDVDAGVTKKVTAGALVEGGGALMLDFSALAALGALDDADAVPILDASVPDTKKVLLSALKAYAQVGVPQIVPTLVGVASTPTNLTGPGIYTVNTALQIDLQLPNPATLTGQLPILILDVTNNAKGKNIQLIPFGSEKIDGVAATKHLAVDGGRWWLLTNGTDWFTVPCEPVGSAAPVVVGRDSITGSGAAAAREDHQHDGGVVVVDNQIAGFTLQPTDEYVRITSAGAITITLPSPASVGARKWYFLLSHDTPGDVTLSRAGSETIQGVAANYVLTGAWTRWTLVCDGANWWLF